jgi:hypothetical protein
MTGDRTDWHQVLAPVAGTIVHGEERISTRELLTKHLGEPGDFGVLCGGSMAPVQASIWGRDAEWLLPKGWCGTADDWSAAYLNACPTGQRKTHDRPTTRRQHGR